MATSLQYTRDSQHTYVWYMVLNCSPQRQGILTLRNQMATAIVTKSAAFSRNCWQYKGFLVHRNATATADAI